MPKPRLKEWYTLSEYATLTGQTLKAVRHQADRGTLPTQKMTGAKKSWRVVYLATVAVEKPDLFASTSLVARYRHRVG